MNEWRWMLSAEKWKPTNQPKTPMVGLHSKQSADDRWIEITLRNKEEWREGKSRALVPCEQYQAIYMYSRSLNNAVLLQCWWEKKLDWQLGPRCGVCIFSPCPHGFSPGPPISSERCAREVNGLVGIAPVGVSGPVCAPRWKGNVLSMY